MDTVPEEDLDKLSLSDCGSRVTCAFHNSFTPLEDLDETGDTTTPSFCRFSSVVASYRRDVFVSHCTPSKIEHLQSPKILHVPPHMIRNIKSPAFQLKVRIDLNGRQFDAHTLLDSGAEGGYCNTSFIEKYSIPTHTVDRPVYPINVDGTLNKQGAMRYAAIL